MQNGFVSGDQAKSTKIYRLHKLEKQTKKINLKPEPNNILQLQSKRPILLNVNRMLIEKPNKNKSVN